MLFINWIRIWQIRRFEAFCFRSAAPWSWRSLRVFLSRQYQLMLLSPRLEAWIIHWTRQVIKSPSDQILSNCEDHWSLTTEIFRIPVAHLQVVFSDYMKISPILHNSSSWPLCCITRPTPIYKYFSSKNLPLQGGSVRTCQCDSVSGFLQPRQLLFKQNVSRGNCPPSSSSQLKFFRR